MSKFEKWHEKAMKGDQNIEEIAWLMEKQKMVYLWNKELYEINYLYVGLYLNGEQVQFIQWNKGETMNTVLNIILNAGKLICRCDDKEYFWMRKNDNLESLILYFVTGPIGQIICAIPNQPIYLMNDLYSKEINAESRIVAGEFITKWLSSIACNTISSKKDIGEAIELAEVY